MPNKLMHSLSRQDRPSATSRLLDMSTTPLKLRTNGSIAALTVKR